MTKKMWSKPELTVLVRSNPEEAVLSVCKTNTELAGGPNLPGRCFVGNGLAGECQALASS